jgi:hypothetical protein
MIASTAVIAFAIGITTVLMVTNWVIWGLNNPRDLRHPSTVTPLKGKAIFETILRRAIATNEVVLPRSAAQLNACGEANANERDNGFKHVA